MKPIKVVSFYRFFAFSADRRAAFSDWLKAFESRLNLRGLFIIGQEGINSTFSILDTNELEFKTELLNFFGWQQTDVTFKESATTRHPFHELSVKERPEIVTLSRPDLVPNGQHQHLTAEQWQKALGEDDVVVIDTRNSYEYEIGHFKGALNPKTREFTEFPNWVKGANIAKDKKVLIYCTGGIRCEKAILELEDQGYKNVHQLDGGILSYLEKYPNSNYEGECFVFDYRVAVQQDLSPTVKYKLCPHCGQPANEKIKCVQCGVEEIVCAHCLEKEEQFKTCSKNCAHHFRMGHKSKRIHHDAFRART